MGKSLPQVGSWTVRSNPIGQFLETGGSGSKDRLSLVFCMGCSQFEQKRPVWGEILLCNIKPPLTSREESHPFTTAEGKNTLLDGSNPMPGTLQEPQHTTSPRWIIITCLPTSERGRSTEWTLTSPHMRVSEKEMPAICPPSLCSCIPIQMIYDLFEECMTVEVLPTHPKPSKETQGRQHRQQCRPGSWHLPQGRKNKGLNEALL